MALTSVAVKQAKPKDKRYILKDEMACIWKSPLLAAAGGGFGTGSKARKIACHWEPTPKSAWLTPESGVAKPEI